MTRVHHNSSPDITIPMCMATSVPMAEYLLAHSATLKVADIKGITPCMLQPAVLNRR